MADQQDAVDRIRQMLRGSAARGRPERLRLALGAFAESGVELTQEELLDALWLAARLPEGASTALARASGTITPARQAYGDGWLPPVPGAQADSTRLRMPREPASADDEPPPPKRRPHPVAPPADADVQPRAVPRTAPSTPLRESPGRSPLYGGTARAPRRNAVPARPVRTPGARALGSRQLQLGRALRPLKQTVADRRRWELDETATADSTAHSGLTDAVLRPARARWLDLTLLVDDGASMLLWQRLATETRLLLERSGAFRDVRVHGLDTRTPGAPLLGRRPFTPGTAVLPPATVTDPGGNTLILVLSDGVGAAWRDGRMRELLKQWGRFGPTAVLHALPPHLWDGSGIRAERWRVTTRRRGAPNLTWDVADPVLPSGLTGFDGVPVPVLAPEPAAVGAWAGLVASPGASAVLPLLTEPFAPAPAAPDPLDTGQHVLRFRDTVSPEAYRLAAHVAAVAPASVPVMRLVQDALGPDVTTGHLAEVFLSGLMRRCDDSVDLAPQHRSYDVTSEARDILLGTAPVRELLRTSRTVTDRLGELAGRSADFPAWLAHPEGAGRVGDGARPFGWVDERLMRRLGVGVGVPRAAPAPSSAGPDVPPHDASTDDVPAYVDAPGSPWRSLQPANPRWAGPWRLFARHSSAKTTSGMFLGRRAEGGVAALRLTRSGSLSRTTLPRQAQALRLLNGCRAPRLIGMDPAAEPSWLAMELHLADGRPAPYLAGRTLDGERYADPGQFALLGLRVAGVLADAHVRGILHGDLVPSRVLLTPDDVCVTGWCVHEHADGVEHDISKLGLVLLGAAGRGLPHSLTDILRRCSSPLLDERPTAREVAEHFRAFVESQTHAPRTDGDADGTLAVPVGRDERGADVVLDFRAMGPHGIIQGSAADWSAVLDGIVCGLAERYSPVAVQFHLFDATQQYLRPATAGTLPHIVAAAGSASLERTLGGERTRRRTLLTEARAMGRPRPELTRLIAVVTPDGLTGETGWLEDLDIHLLVLDGPERGPLDLDFRIDLTGRDPVLHHSRAPSSGIPFRLPLPRRVPYEAMYADEFQAAVTHGRQGHHHAALGWLERIAARQLEHLGPDHPHLLSTQYETGHLQLALDRLDDALQTFSNCATRRAEVLGNEHADTLTAHQQFAFVLARMGRHDEAHTVYRIVLRLWENVRGHTHPDTLLCRHNLAVTLIALRHYTKAVVEARAARSGRESVLGSEHPDTLASGHELAVALHRSGILAEAIDIARSVLEARERVLGPIHPGTLATYRLMRDLGLPGR
ncbi:SAV_2336 N-terminal domain-related protein [Streptomyces sp. NPDC059002]|uniref:SAV_2336 N-terminal domain-related protein n=1 Tax=Streptomyces sp. NPDC059002 TaxID=3346690 RepID=UPI00367C96B2